MAAKETGKQKTARIPLDYYKRPDPFLRWKLALAAVAVILAAVWAMLGIARPVSQYSPGPVASVHATWEADCMACHTPFVAIRNDAWQSDLAAKAEIDAKCQKCHRTSEHHFAERKQDVANCSSCHREHGGRDAQLTRPSDQTCTACHANLPAHTVKPEAIVTTGPFAFDRVSKFAAESHPQFRSATSDPGKLKFSHRRHLAPGLNWGANDRFKPQRLRDLAPGDRERYRAIGATDDDLIQLNCNACHQLAVDSNVAPLGGNLLGSLAPRRALEAYMAPVSFENHCRACHPLNYAPAATAAERPAVVEHGLTPEKLKEFLEGTFARALLEDNPSWLEQRAVEREIPGKSVVVDSPRARAWIDQKMRVAETFLRGRCSQCHDLVDLPTAAAVAPTNVPKVWFQHARFDHRAHRAWACQHCHQPDAKDQPNYLLDTWRPGEREPPLDHTDVLIPRLENCLQCHSDRPASGSAGQARNDCVECHSYHGGDYWQNARHKSSGNGILEPRLRESLNLLDAK